MEKKRMGRPPKAPEDRAGPQVQFRVRGNVKAEIERQAKLVGRSISEECEFRLTRSVENDIALAEMLAAAKPDSDSDKLQRLLIAVGNAARYAFYAAGKSELQVEAAIIGVVEKLTDMKAAALLSRASENGMEWQKVAERVAALERGDLEPIKSLAEIMGR